VRYLILSDIHSNLEALEAVLSHASALGFEKAVVLGDLVGYGADPNAVVDRVRLLPGLTVIRGNHDKVVSGQDTGEEFNELALSSCRWTREHMTQENLHYIAQLPAGPQRVDDRFSIAHGTPLDEDAYILSELDAAVVFADLHDDICFFGHSHIPILFSFDPDAGIAFNYPTLDEEGFRLEQGKRYLINVGSVGQPRDRNPKAAYGLFDLESRTVFLYRVFYPIAETQRKIVQAGIPSFLAERLKWGA
jgi:diadenosine tetraphosphatase ApaH/serine/threonine PP2A family protein phosphatase